MRRPTIVAILALGVVLSLTVLVSDSESLNRSRQPDTTSTATNKTSIPGDIVFPVEVSVARRGDFVRRRSATGILRAKRKMDVELVGEEAVTKTFCDIPSASGGPSLMVSWELQQSFTLVCQESPLVSSSDSSMKVCEASLR